MSDWSSYRLQDFIPFTADIYFRLLERMGETFWPLHLLTLALGTAALLFALKNRARVACLLLAPPWAFIAVAFFMQRYAELNWAGGYIGWAFLAQALFLVLIALVRSAPLEPPQFTNPAVITGIAIALSGLVGLPLLAPPGGHSWYRAEIFGIHPDPTAIVTLGLALIALRGPAMWAASIIPTLWLLLSGLTHMALG
ncbi:DUF6064 family protein [Microbulbifer litoralis]|uniref:DUF6064 family protein n=1 Tax=Microbulbifer litoralis TaxID=2933965 RepID=UPI0020284AAE|nr:DUF6064 family protein [Microbulbifer sp. GX H0434]